MLFLRKPPITRPRTESTNIMNLVFVYVRGSWVIFFHPRNFAAIRRPNKAGRHKKNIAIIHMQL